MYCHRCGASNDDNAYKCTSCGNVLAREDAQAGAGAAPPPPPALGPFPPPPSMATAGPGPGSGLGPTEQVPNYLVPAIITTLCCCLIPGIVAIVYAAQVNGMVASGNIEGARAASRNAKMWTWIAFGLGAAVAVFYGLAVVAGALSGAHH